MQYFYNTFAIVSGILAPFFIISIVQAIKNFFVLAVYYAEIRHRKSDFFKRRWVFKEQIQPPNPRMTTIVLREIDEQNTIEFSVDKGVIK